MPLRSRLVDGPTSLAARGRSRRWALLARVFPDLPSYHVLDLGGTPDSWLRAPVRPKAVTLVNLHGGELVADTTGLPLPDWLTPVTGDACDPPAAVGSGDYDLVFSNSLLEHVGGPVRRRMLADTIRGAAPRYWVQTPYRYFPVEPHYIFPGFQFLPLAARARITRFWPLIHTRAGTWEDSIRTALEVELVSLTEMRFLFPDAVMHRERLGGLTKSIIAVRT